MLNHIRLGYATTVLLASAALLFASGAQAMPFQQFDHMAAQDRQDYLDFLPKAAETVLRQQGRDDDAAKVHQLFNEIHPGDALSIGPITPYPLVSRCRCADPGA